MTEKKEGNPTTSQGVPFRILCLRVTRRLTQPAYHGDVDRERQYTRLSGRGQSGKALEDLTLEWGMGSMGPFADRVLEAQVEEKSLLSVTGTETDGKRDARDNLQA